MLRRIKKWYFKIYHLFKLLGIFILIFGLKEIVYAEEYNSCFDDLKIDNVNQLLWSDNLIRFRPALRVQPNTTYYVRYFPETNFICPDNTECFYNRFLYWDANNKYIGALETSSEWDNKKQVLKFTTTNVYKTTPLPLSVSPIIYSDYSGYNNFVDHPFIVSTNLNDVLYCGGIEPTQESVYSSFLTLYTDKISYLAEGFTKNPYLIAMIGIIFSFVVLELFLKILHLKGGYRK